MLRYLAKAFASPTMRCLSLVHLFSERYRLHTHMGCPSQLWLTGAAQRIHMRHLAVCCIFSGQTRALRCQAASALVFPIWQTISQASDICRLAPLSQGRVEPSDGTLQCSLPRVALRWVRAGSCHPPGSPRQPPGRENVLRKQALVRGNLPHTGESSRVESVSCPGNSASIM